MLDIIVLNGLLILVMSAEHCTTSGARSSLFAKKLFVWCSLPLLLVWQITAKSALCFSSFSLPFKPRSFNVIILIFWQFGGALFFNRVNLYLCSRRLNHPIQGCCCCEINKFNSSKYQPQDIYPEIELPSFPGQPSFSVTVFLPLAFEVKLLYTARQWFDLLSLLLYLHFRFNSTRTCKREKGTLAGFFNPCSSFPEINVTLEIFFLLHPSVLVAAPLYNLTYRVITGRLRSWAWTQQRSWALVTSLIRRSSIARPFRPPNFLINSKYAVCFSFPIGWF